MFSFPGSLFQDPLSQRKTIFPSKIVGGLPAGPEQFPYQLSLRVNGHHFCGASLIQVEDILLAITAAHCVDSDNYPGTLFVVAGDVNISDTSGHEQIREVVKIVIHDDYSRHPSGIFNDIALLFLDEPFKLDKNVNVIKLPDDDQVTEGMLIVSGWGTLYSGGEIPDQLQYVTLPVVSQTVCQAKWESHPYFPIEIGDGILCAGDDDGEKSACHGDSGGPAMSITKNYLAGIVSFGDREYRGYFKLQSYRKKM